MAVAHCNAVRYNPATGIRMGRDDQCPPAPFGSRDQPLQARRAYLIDCEESRDEAAEDEHGDRKYR